MAIVELRKGDPKLVALVCEAEDSEIAAGGGRKGKRAEYYCAACGYGIVVYGQPPSCPMCNEGRWEHVEWRPFTQLLDDERDLAAKRRQMKQEKKQAATARKLAAVNSDPMRVRLQDADAPTTAISSPHE